MIYFCACNIEMQNHKYLNIYHMWSASEKEKEKDITKMCMIKSNIKLSHGGSQRTFCCKAKLRRKRYKFKGLILNYLISFHPSSILIIVLKVQDESSKLLFCVYILNIQHHSNQKLFFIDSKQAHCQNFEYLKDISN